MSVYRLLLVFVLEPDKFDGIGGLLVGLLGGFDLFFNLGGILGADIIHDDRGFPVLGHLGFESKGAAHQNITGGMKSVVNHQFVFHVYRRYLVLVIRGLVNGNGGHVVWRQQLIT